MKTIPTEWGEMPLNDWREIKLNAANICARKALIASSLTMLSMILFPVAIVALTIDSFYCGFHEKPWQQLGSYLMALATIEIGKRVICSFMDLRVKYMLARQEIVDEVAATMKENK